MDEEEQTLDFADYLSAFKRRRGTILAIASAIFLIGLLAALFWPPTYRSSATILIKEQEIPPELVTSTVTSFASQRIQTISQYVMARKNLLEIIDKYNLYEKQSDRMTTEEILQEMRNNINLNMIDAQVVDPRSGRPTSATIAFALNFSGDDPGQVQKVTNELTSLYLSENLKERSEKASETYLFLSSETQRLNQEIVDLETKLAAFKEANANSLPGLKDLNLTLMDRTDREIIDIDTQIRTLEERKIYLDAQLVQVKPYGSDASVDPSTRIQALRNEYYRLISRYSPDHPDVIRTKREIEGLELETGQVSSAGSQLEQITTLTSELAALRKKYSDEHPDVVRLQKQIASLKAAAPASTQRLSTAAQNNPNNPAYISLQSQVAAANSEIRSLEIKQRLLRQKLLEYEKRLTATPQVELEFSKLGRDLLNKTAKYQELKAKQDQAQIAQQLETESKGEQFVLIEPAIRPEEPISPNRPAIVFLSLVLALGSGMGFAAVAESIDDTLHGSKALQATTGGAALAQIPYLTTDREKSSSRLKFTASIMAFFLTITLILALLHFFWTPLDVLWYKVIRKADIMINT
ncbi:MAG: Wzz/FepE/Etk N-terminal domain-containing protein [Gammaproteobacteria bacterium]